MTDVYEFTSSGSSKGKHLEDPDEVLVRDGLEDEQTGRLKRSVAISTRAKAAAALRVHGAEYSEIAEKLEYPSPADARRAVEQVLAATVDETKDYMALRALASLRLEGLLKAVAGRAMDPEDSEQLGFHRAALSVVDRWIKLHGLDAPQRLQLLNPSAEEFEQVINVMVAHVTAEEEDEPDILSIEAAPTGVRWDESDDGG